MNDIRPHHTARRRRIPHLLAWMAFGAVLLAAGCPIPASAEVRVEGRLDAVRLETAGSSVEQVLAALGATYGLRYRAAIALDRTLTGVYQGPLERVLARVLDSYDFVTKSSAGGVEVIILSERGGHSSPRAGQGLPPPPPSPAAMVPTPAGPVPAQTSAAPPPNGEAQLELLRRSLEALKR